MRDVGGKTRGPEWLDIENSFSSSVNTTANTAKNIGGFVGGAISLVVENNEVSNNER